MAPRLLATIVLTALVAGCGGSEEAEVAAAAVAGPPCPSLTAQQFAAQGRTLDEQSTVGSVTVRRLSGRATCAAAGTSGSGGTSEGVRCDLTNPGLVHVSAAGAEHYFDIAAAQPATVAVQGGAVRCVLVPRP